MAEVRKRVALPLVGSDIFQVIRPSQNSSQLLDVNLSELYSFITNQFASGFVPVSRTLTINGITYDLSQDRSWTVSGGSAAWGSIGTGTGVGSQADLVAYLLANYQPLGSYVTSVNGLTGVVSLALDDISNVNAPSPTVGQLLQWNGTNWVPATVTGTGTVQQVNTGTGLTGGPFTVTGTVSLNSKLAPADSLAGNALKFLRVNAGATAVEYATVSTGDSISPFLLMGG